MDTICVIGLGYIGLPTALMLASKGASVVGVDYNIDLVGQLKNGNITFKEPELEHIFHNALENGITFTEKYVNADIYIIAVPTPYNKFSKKIDASYVIAAVKNIMKICPKGAVLIIESTVSPGTIDNHIRTVVEAHDFIIGQDLHLVHAPERIIPGNMVYELEHNSRTIGVDDKKIGERVKNIYSTFCKGNIIITDIRTAEMTKVIENTFRDINIAFANELAKICREDKMDVYEIIRIANMHPRVNILQPGPGVGGHCISVDPWFLVGDYSGLANLIRQARMVNDSMPEFVLKRIYEIMNENNINDTSRIGLYGLTYKEDVDDTRESPALQLLESVKKHLGQPLKTYDPVVSNSITQNQYKDFDKFLQDIDMIVILVSHTHIKQNMLKLKEKIIFDTKNICTLDNVYKL